jgi:hypothetical protein
MKLSYINSFGNKGNTFVSQGISKESLPYQANSNNTPKYLTPDYFLASSHSKSYYKKYSGNHSSTSIGSNAICQSKRRKISRVASIMLLSLGVLATVVEVKASDSIELQKEASSGQQKEYKFEAINLSNNLPDVVPSFPLPDVVPLEPSNPPIPSAPPMPDIVPPVVLPDVVPVPLAPPAPPPMPPVAPPMPDLLGDASSSMPKQKTGFMAAMKDIVKGNFKLKIHVTQ